MRIYGAIGDAGSTNPRRGLGSAYTQPLGRSPPQHCPRLRRGGPFGSPIPYWAANPLHQEPELSLIFEAKRGGDLDGVERYDSLLGYAPKPKQRCKRPTPLLVETADLDPANRPVGCPHASGELLPDGAKRTETIPRHCQIHGVIRHPVIP